MKDDNKVPRGKVTVQPLILNQDFPYASYSDKRRNFFFQVGTRISDYFMNQKIKIINISINFNDHAGPGSSQAFVAYFKINVLFQDHIWKIYSEWHSMAQKKFGEKYYHPQSKKCTTGMLTTKLGSTTYHDKLAAEAGGVLDVPLAAENVQTTICEQIKDVIREGLLKLWLETAVMKKQIN